MLDLVTRVKTDLGAHIFLSFLGMWSLIHLRYVSERAAGAKGNYLSGKLRSCVGVWPIQDGGWR